MSKFEIGDELCFVPNRGQVTEWRKRYEGVKHTVIGFDGFGDAVTDIDQKHHYKCGFDDCFYIPWSEATPMQKAGLCVGDVILCRGDKWRISKIYDGCKFVALSLCGGDPLDKYVISLEEDFTRLFDDEPKEPVLDPDGLPVDRKEMHKFGSKAWLETQGVNYHVYSATIEVERPNNDGMLSRDGHSQSEMAVIKKPVEEKPKEFVRGSLRRLFRLPVPE